MKFNIKKILKYFYIKIIYYYHNKKNKKKKKTKFKKNYIIN